MKIGQKFGKLIIIKEIKPHILFCGQKKKVLCQCECGIIKEIVYDNLKTGHTKSCGCLRKEKNIKHGMTRTKFYKVWRQIKQRCNNKNCKSYKNYGGRGIKVCKEWLNFINFRDDMYDSYLEHKKNNDYTSIERIDNNKGYYKDNCKFSIIIEQLNNRRNNV